MNGKPSWQRNETSNGSQGRKKIKKLLSLNKEKHHENSRENYEIDFTDSDSDTPSTLLAKQKTKKTTKLNRVAADNVLKRRNAIEAGPSSVKRLKNVDDLFSDSFRCYDDTQTLLTKTANKTRVAGSLLTKEFITNNDKEDIIPNTFANIGKQPLNSDLNFTFDDIFTVNSQEFMENNNVASNSKTNSDSKQYLVNEVEKNSESEVNSSLDDLLSEFNNKKKPYDYNDIFVINVPVEDTVNNVQKSANTVAQDSYSCFFQTQPLNGQLKTDMNKDNIHKSVFTQFYDNSQLIKQIDKVINECTTKSESNKTKTTNNKKRCNIIKRNTKAVESKTEDFYNFATPFNYEPPSTQIARINNLLKGSNNDDKIEKNYRNNKPINVELDEHVSTLTDVLPSTSFAQTSTPLKNQQNTTKKLDQLDDLVTTFIDNFPSTSKATTSTPLKQKPVAKLASDFWDETMNYKLSQVFQTSQYKREMEKQFDKLEDSIHDFGTNQDTSLTRTKKSPTRDVIQNLLERTFKSPEMIKKVLQSAEESIRVSTTLNPWSDDSLLANAVINMSIEGQSIGSLIKKVLLENVRKSISPQKLVNATIRDDDVEFRNCGDFYGLPDQVKDLIKQYKGIDQVYEWQDECLNLPAIKERKNLVYALPTSGGKTLVAEILILREVLCRRKNALFILPYVAIVQEKVWALSPFAVSLEFLIEEYAAGKGSFPPRKRRRKNSVYIATMEKALGLINSLIELERTDEIGLIVVDELHLIGDNSRGPVLEELLTKVMYLKDKIQIVGMSATIGNLSEICQFLKAEVYTRNFRPVELIEYVKCGEEIAKVDWNARSENDILVFERRVNYQYPESCCKLDPDHLGGLVMEVIPKASCLIFCRSKQNCENVAILICKIITSDLRNYKTKEKEVIKKALKDEAGSLCKVLNITISFGIAYHHSGLTSEERRIIEEGFRQGVISVICCTSTLAAGVNLPAKRVIIRNPYVALDFINLSRYKQMVGRAGRAGFGEMGESILISTPQELPRVRELFKSPMDTALSAMHVNECRGLQQFVLSCISLKMANTKEAIQEISSSTLMAIQKQKLNVNIKELSRNTIKGLFKKGALQMDGQNINDESPISDITVRLDTTCSDISSDDASMSRPKTTVTVTNDTRLFISKMGRAALKGGLDLGRAHMLYEDLLQAQFSLVLFTGLHLMYLVTPYDISERVSPSKPHYYTLYTQLSPKELQTAKVLGFSDAVAVQLLTNKKITEIPERILNRFYVTLMLYELWNEVPLYDVAVKYEVNRGQIQNLMTTAASFASNVFHFCEELEEFWAFSLLLKGMSERLSHCCVKELVPLMQLPSVKQNRAKQLYNAGYKTLQSIAKANPDELVQNIEYMSRKLANQLIAAAKLFLLERVENLREEAEDVLDGVDF